MSGGPVTRPWLRLLRFSVRSMVVVVIVIGVWLGIIVHQAHVQRDAAAAIKRAGGSVFYEWEKSSANPIPKAKPPRAPRVLVDFIGVDYFGHITEATIDGKTDEMIAQVKRLTQLEGLSFTGSCISDDGLAYLKGLNKLKVLNLGFGRVTYAGLAHLKGLKNLVMLAYNGHDVTAAERAELRRAFPKTTTIVLDVPD
jgi:hypothetical protein